MYTYDSSNVLVRDSSSSDRVLELAGNDSVQRRGVDSLSDVPLTSCSGGDACAELRKEDYTRQSSSSSSSNKGDSEIAKAVAMNGTAQVGGVFVLGPVLGFFAKLLSRKSDDTTNGEGSMNLKNAGIDASGKEVDGTSSTTFSKEGAPHHTTASSSTTTTASKTIAVQETARNASTGVTCLAQTNPAIA